MFVVDVGMRGSSHSITFFSSSFPWKDGGKKGVVAGRYADSGFVWGCFIIASFLSGMGWGDFTLGVVICAFDFVLMSGSCEAADSAPSRLITLVLDDFLSVVVVDAVVVDDGVVAVAVFVVVVTVLILAIS